MKIVEISKEIKHAIIVADMSPPIVFGRIRIQDATLSLPIEHWFMGIGSFKEMNAELLKRISYEQASRCPA